MCYHHDKGHVTCPACYCFSRQGGCTQGPTKPTKSTALVLTPHFHPHLEFPLSPAMVRKLAPEVTSFSGARWSENPLERVFRLGPSGSFLGHS